MRTTSRTSPVRRQWPRDLFGAGAFALALALVAACGSTSSSIRPSASLIDLEFTPIPTLEVEPTPSPPRSATPEPTLAPWPVGWDVAFCTAFADTTVAHELLIDIERAMEEDEREDAAGLANDLAQTAPLAGGEVERMREWEPAATVKEGMTELVALQIEAATAYQSFFTDSVRSSLREARQVRKQASRAIPGLNEELQTLTDLGLACPGADLVMETF